MKRVKGELTHRHALRIHQGRVVEVDTRVDEVCRSVSGLQAERLKLLNMSGASEALRREVRSSQQTAVTVHSEQLSRIARRGQRFTLDR